MAGRSSDVDLSTPVLRTKLHAPRRRAGTVERRRLTDGAPGAAHPRLILVSAPAGFGKTTLLAQWFVQRGGVTAAWLSLDERDDDPASFWTSVVAALRTVVPTVGEATMQTLRTHPSRSVDAAEALVAELEAAGEPVVLLLDDYHVIGSPEVHDGVATFLDRLPDHVQVGIATRVDPPLPLARLRARGELIERRAADLRFTPTEAAEYFAATMGLTLDGGQVAALEARTEGWAAAMQLAALSLQDRDDVAGFIESFTGDDRFVVDYLVEEVLDRQPPGVRDFLEQTSVLGRLCGPLCDAVTGATDGRATLERLDRGNLFLVPLDDRREWYRYHHLFGDVLRARLLAERPGSAPELHRRAAAWWAANDDPVEAIGHALAAPDVERAAELIELAALGQLRTRREVVVRSWLEALPPEVFVERPVLSVLLVGARLSTGDATGVDELLTGAERWLTTAGPDEPAPTVVDRESFALMPAQIAIYRAALALLAGDVDDVAVHAERALALTRPGDHLQRGSATALAGLASWTSGALEPARTRYAEAIEHLVRAEHFADALGCAQGLADMCRAQGRLGDAIRALTAGLQLLAEHPGLRGAADLHVGLGELYLERGELELARRHLDTGTALGEHAGLPQYPYRWRVAAALLAQTDGDDARALALLQEAERAYDTDFSPSVRPIAALTARVHLARGDVDAALRWAEARGLRADDPCTYLTEFEHLTLARALAAAQVRDRRDAGAGGLLDRLLAAAEEGARTGAVIEVLALRAVLLHATGERMAATAALERSLDLAEPDRHVRVFLDLGPALDAVLRTSTFGGAAGSHAEVVRAAMAGSAVSPGSAPALVDELSGRELDVLRLLRSELSGPDIARELFVSLNTVRTHTKSIYAKLGVRSRREAVRRADELGL